ncbi:ABC transporter substrate-binding protein [Bacillus sp. Hm123]|uniref:ABC transporter substrate-binding protein n=1 Tax=Bacillus sp. Hm123 TaxID=3450745 RepID=UPI003F424A09
MKLKWLALLGLLLLLAACSNQTDKEGAKNKEGDVGKETKIITYLGEEYEVPENPERVVYLNAFESLEDAVLLGIEPYASSAIGDENEPFPDFFADVTKKTLPILTYSDESLEYVLELNPDLIISSDMEDPTVFKQLKKIATTIPVSHFGPDWDKNLTLLSEIYNKQSEASKLIEQYNKDRQEAVNYLESFKDKQVLTIRIRGGEMMLYPENVFLNDIFYGELGLNTPDIIKQTTEQSAISLERLYEVNPDYLFIQYDIYENDMDETILQKLEESEIWKSLQAVKNDRVFVNKVNPLSMGSPTLFGRYEILNAARDHIK